MKLLLKNGAVVNVFTGELEKSNVLIENDKIIGVGDYQDEEADAVENVEGKYICPGFIDGHIHIESTMLTPAELANMCMPHGTTAVVADPHEIANVCGTDGISYMLEMSEGISLTVYFNLPSCVPASAFDESGAILSAADLKPFYSHSRVLGLAEMMNFPGVLSGDISVLEKIADAIDNNKAVDGHAPFLRGKQLDKYIAAGVQSDHECSMVEEAKEKLRKGQWIMIREGTAARNLDTLLPLFEQPFCHRCILVTDDRHPADIKNEGHIDNIIRKAANAGKSVITAIQMATIQTAQCFGIKYVGAVAPGYRADLLVLNDLNGVDVCDVYARGVKVVDNKTMKKVNSPKVNEALKNRVYNSFNVNDVTSKDFYIEEKSSKCRVIEIVPGQIITKELVCNIDFGKNNGIDVQRDILKLAVIERHNNTSHKGVGFIKGIGLKKGAIASSVSHDSHNLIVIGTNDEDMAIAANHICKSGGNVVVVDGGVVAEMPLPIAGLMTDLDGEKIARLNEDVRKSVYGLGVPQDVEPFMNMAFVSLSVIPSLKMTTLGLVDVNKQKIVSLYV